MIRFNYSISSFDHFLNDLAKALGTNIRDNTLELPERVGAGYLKKVDLPNGLQALLIDFTLKQDLLIERAKTNREFYVFICDKVTHVKNLYVNLDDEKTENKASSLSAIYLVSFLSDLQQFATAGTHLRSIRVIIGNEWLASYLHIDKMDEVLQRYLALKSKSIHVKPLDFDNNLLMDEIFQPVEQANMEATYLQNRIMLMLEKFFAWMYEQMSYMQMSLRLSRDDIDVLLKVESELVDNLALAPTINDLSRSAAISPSKLKKQFKEVYGLPPYEYFQKQRMQKARLMLLEGGRSIKEVGQTLGYANLSNFTLAFKKEFSMLPSELVRNRV